jgi:hypothetical protein
MLELPDYYAILDVPATASRDEIRVAYRRLARRYHPDVNPSHEDDRLANEFMRRLNEAYEVLNDPRQRALYDRQRWAQAPPPRLETPYRPDPGGPLSEDAGWGPQASGGRWREPKSRRVIYDQPMPGWARSLFVIGEHLKVRFEPVWGLLGIMVPVLAASLLLVVGFWAYEGVRADPNAVGFLTCVVNAAGGIWVVFGVFGVLFMVFLIAWFAVWRAFNT